MFWDDERTLKEVISLHARSSSFTTDMGSLLGNVARGVLRTSTHPTLNLPFLLRGSVGAFTFKVIHAPISVEWLFSMTLLHGYRCIAEWVERWQLGARGAAGRGLPLVHFSSEP
jgi:hypothetical protein